MLTNVSKMHNIIIYFNSDNNVNNVNNNDMILIDRMTMNSWNPRLTSPACQGWERSVTPPTLNCSKFWDKDHSARYASTHIFF